MSAALGVFSLLLGVSYLYSVAAVHDIEQRYPRTGQTIDVEGINLHYMDVGQGDPLVLVHGATANLWDLQASIAPRLASAHRVIAFDRPGYGYSERPQGPWTDPAHQARLLHGALAKMGIGRATLVGHSLGGAIVLAYALAYPQSTTGVALIGGTAYPWLGGVAWTNHVATWPLLGPVFTHAVVLPGAALLLDRGIGEVFAPNAPPADYALRTRLLLALRPGPFRASAEDVLRLSPYLEQQSRRYENLRMPVLLITGDEDRTVPAWNHAQRLARLLPNARLVVFERTGHAPHHVHAQAVARLVLALAAQDGGATK